MCIGEIAFGYTGQLKDSYSGLMDYKARMYDPALGRFLQPDSIVPGMGNPQNLNRYSYVGNSPTNFSDPTGHMITCMDGDICAYPRTIPSLLIFSSEGNRTWTDGEKDVLAAGASDVAHALARQINTENRFITRTKGVDLEIISPEDAFLTAYDGRVNVVRKAGTCAVVVGYIFPGCGGWSFSNSRNEIWIFDNASPKIIVAYPRLIIHELGHSFDKASGMSSAMPGNTKNRNGFYGPHSSWQLSTDMADTEIYADMFVGWVYGKWQGSDDGNLTLAAFAKSASMTNMAFYITKAMGK